MLAYQIWRMPVAPLPVLTTFGVLADRNTFVEDVGRRVCKESDVFDEAAVPTT